MTTHPNETPEPLAGATVDFCISALVSALQRDKGWLHDYADSVVRDAIDRKHLEPLAQEQAGEMPKPDIRVDAFGDITATDRRRFVMGDFYTAQQMREYRAAALQAKDAEIARLKVALQQAKSDMRGVIENSLCAADPDRPFSEVRQEVKQHPLLKAIDDVLTGGRNA